MVAKITALAVRALEVAILAAWLEQMVTPPQVVTEEMEVLLRQGAPEMEG